MNFTTADLCDSYPDAQIAAPVFRDFGAHSTFHGRIVTVKVFEDNAMVRAVLEEPAEGRILVVDGGGSLRCALVGGNMAALGVANGWRGMVINGCIRDSQEIGRIGIGVKALGTHPRKSEKGLHLGHRDRSVSFAGVDFTSGGWLYADPDGIVVSRVELPG
jgi:regulator of ribonuclease activity A